MALYFGQRYCAADLGWRITPDPLEFKDSPNLYAYVHNNRLSTRHLDRGRSAYWHEASGTLVVRNPAAIDGGTAFVPRMGVTHFREVLK